MLKMILKKIKNKKWLTLCLFLGVAFLIAAFSCFPMFKNGAVDVMIRNEFENQKESTNKYPFVLSIEKKYISDDAKTIDEADKITDKYHQSFEKEMKGLEVVERQRYYSMKALSAKTTVSRLGGSFELVYEPGLLEHTNVLAGVDYASEENDSPFVCVVSPNTYDTYKATIGENVTFFNLKDGNSNFLNLKICGVIDAKDLADPYWHEGVNENSLRIYINKECFDALREKYGIDAFFYKEHVKFDYSGVTNENIDDVIQALRTLRKQDSEISFNFADVIKNYVSGKRTISISIWVLQIPTLGMVITFIFMVSRQILESEKNEMAMKHSRGIKRSQIIYMYAIQSGIVSFMSLIAGLPMGYGACKLAAGSKDFLAFSTDNIGMYKPCIEMVIYGLLAALVGMIVVIIPVFKYSKVSIVEHKASFSAKKKMAIYKYFLDIALLIASIYLYVNYNRGIETVRINALNGSKMDPMIFLNIVMFIISAGLVMIRLCNYLVRFVYFIGKKKWKPAKYISFLQITRNFNKQCFISVFLILTISMGIFYSNSSRTINGNYVERIQYNVGTDIAFMQKWKADFYTDEQGLFNYEYVEPDYNLYLELVEKGICTNLTRVIRTDDKVTANVGNKKIDECVFMGINTKEFGEVANFKNGWNVKEHWFNYLNSLAEQSGGVIISSSVADFFNVKVGQTIDVTRLGELGAYRGKERGKYSAKVCAIVDNWPGFTRYYYADGKLKENYLIVMNYGKSIDAYQVAPYEVWFDLAEGHTVNEVYNYLEEQGVVCKYKKSTFEEIDKLRYDYILQITNGMFTLSFIIAIVLCLIGFLIYWISSISQRQLLFGIYRAMGISVKEINGMLINEHIFSTFLSVLAGVGVGIATSLTFTKLFTVIYLPERHNIPIEIIYRLSDYMKLGVIIIFMIVVCILCLRKIVRNMDITKSLKLGED